MARKTTGTGHYARGCGGTRLLARAWYCVGAAGFGGFLVAIFACPASAQATGADKVRISGLSDASFGTITTLSADAIRTQSICVYSKAPPSDNYRITASGSGDGGAFTLASGTETLPYEVQWSDTAGQSSGTLLSPNVPLASQRNFAGNDDCSRGAATTASLIVVLRSTNLSAAIAGSYNGSLTLLVAPE